MVTISEFSCEDSARIPARKRRAMILPSRLINPDHHHRHLHRSLLPVSLTNERSWGALTVSKSSFARTSSPSRPIDHSNREGGIRTASVSAIILGWKTSVGVSLRCAHTASKWRAAASGANRRNIWVGVRSILHVIRFDVAINFAIEKILPRYNSYSFSRINI